MLGIATPPQFVLSQMAKRHTEESLFLRYAPDEMFSDAIDIYRITVRRGAVCVTQIETPDLSVRVHDLEPGTSYEYVQ